MISVVNSFQQYLHDSVKDIHSNEGGFSIWSALGWMAFAGVMFSIVFGYMDDIMSRLGGMNHRQSTMSLQQNIQRLYQAQKDYSGLDNQTAVDGGAIPSSMTHYDDGTILNQWDGDVTLEPRNSGRFFAMVFAGLPEEACVNAATISGDFNSIEINGTTISNLPVGVSQATSNCNGPDNSVTYVTS